MASINRERRRGATPSEIETLIIAAARKLVREGAIQPPRRPDAYRLFFDPLTPFLVDGAGLKKQPARIERTSLQGILTWLKRDLMPGLPDLIAQIDAAIDAGDDDHADVLADATRAEAVAAIRAAVAAVRQDDRGRMRLAVQAGGGACLEDAREFAAIVEQRGPLELLRTGLPERIAELRGAQLANYMKLIGSVCAGAPDIRPHAVAILMHRLEKPVQIIRLAKHDAGSDAAPKLKASSFAVAGDLVLYDIRHAARTTARLLKARATEDEVYVHLFDYYALAHGMRVEAELPKGDPWTASIGRASRLVSDRLAPVISSAPRLIKQALMPRGGAPVHTPDEADLAAAEYGIAMLQQTRTFISELALNDVLDRSTKELDHYIGTIGDFIVQRISNAGRDRHADAQALLRGTVRLTRAASGGEMADLLQRAGNIALARSSGQRATAG